MKITWNTDVRAPGCPGEIVTEDDRTLLIQSDWDFPGVASTFGWSCRRVQIRPGFDCDHRGTDGTVTCPDCYVSAARFIEDARVWLEEHDGATADDPGYFTESP